MYAVNINQSIFDLVDFAQRLWIHVENCDGSSVRVDYWPNGKKGSVEQYWVNGEEFLDVLDNTPAKDDGEEYSADEIVTMACEIGF